MAGTDQSTTKLDGERSDGRHFTSEDQVTTERSAASALAALQRDSSLALPSKAEKPTESSAIEATKDTTHSDLVLASVKALQVASNSEQILAVLRGKSESERADIVERYGQETKSSFLSVLAEKGISKVEYVEIVAAIRHQDGTPETAAAIERSLAAIDETNKSSNPETIKQSERLLREAVGTLNSDELKALDLKLRQNHKGLGLSELLLGDKRISQGTRNAIELQLYGDHQESAASNRPLRGTDFRNTHPEVALALAENALKNKDINLFQEAMRGAPEESRTKFALGQNNQNGEQRLSSVFRGEELDRARDFMDHGGISLQSLVTANDRQFLLWRNQDGIDVALRAARPEDVESYRRGELLALESTDKNKLTVEQKRDLDFYDSLHTRLKEAFSNPGELIAKEDLLLNNGSFVSTYATGRNADERFSAIEHMPESARQELLQNQQLKEQLLRSIAELAPGVEGDRARQLLERKLLATTEADANKVWRTVSETLQDNPPPPYKPTPVLNSLANMSGDEATRYRQDSEFKSSLDTQLREYFSEQELQGLTNNTTRPQIKLSEKILAAVYNGEDPLKDATNRLMLQALNATEGYNQSLPGSLTTLTSKPEMAKGLEQEIEKALRNDPVLAAKVRENPNSPEAQDLSFALSVAAGAAQFEVQNQTLGPMYSKLFKEGHLDLADRVQFAQSNEDRYSIIVSADVSAEERQRLLQENANGPARELQEIVFAGMSKEHRTVLTNGIQNGQLDAPDKIRLAVLDSHISTANLSTILQGQDLSTVKEIYAKRYHSDLDADVLAKAPSESRLPLSELLSYTKVAATDQFLVRQQDQSLRSGGSFWGSAGDTANLEATSNNIARMLTQASAENSQLNNAEYQRRIGAMDMAITQYDKDKNRTREMLDKAIQTTIQVAVLASAVLSDGLTLPIALTLAGGAFHAGLSAETDPWSLTKNFIKGGVDAGLMAIPGSQMGAMLRITDSAAGITATKLAGNSVLREGAEAQLQTSLQGIANQAVKSGNVKIGQDEFTALATSVARPNATQAEITKLAATVQTEFQAAVNAGASQYFTASVQLREAAKMGAATGAFAGTVNGALEYDPKQSIGKTLEKIATSAGVAALEGAGMTVAFGYGINSARGILRRETDGTMTVQNDSSGRNELEIVRVDSNGKEIIVALPRGTDTPILATDQLRLRAANDNFVPTIAPQDALALPSLEITGHDLRVKATETKLIAANENAPFIEQRLVVNGSNQSIVTMAQENTRRQTLTIMDGGQSRPGLSERGVETRSSGRDPLRPAELAAEMKTSLTPEAYERALGPENFTRLKALETNPKYKADIDWLKANSGKTDAKAFSDLIILKQQTDVKRQRGESTIEVPLERLRDADASTLKFIRDRLVDANQAFNIPTSIQHGKQYEYAAHQMLMKKFSGEAPDRIAAPDLDIPGQTKTFTADLRDWIFIPSAQNSPIDHAGIDGIFINVRDGRFTPVDIKNNEGTQNRGKNTDNFLTITFDKGSDQRAIDRTTGLFIRQPGIDIVTEQLARILSTERAASQSVHVSSFGPGKVEYPNGEARTNSQMATVLDSFIKQARSTEKLFFSQLADKVQGASTYYKKQPDGNAPATEIPDKPQLASPAKIVPTETQLDPIKAEEQKRVASEHSAHRLEYPEISPAESIKLTEYRKAIGDNNISLDQVKESEAILEGHRKLGTKPPEIDEVLLNVMDGATQQKLAELREAENLLDAHIKLGIKPPKPAEILNSVENGLTTSDFILSKMKPLQDELFGWLNGQKAAINELNKPILEKFFTTGSKMTEQELSTVKKIFERAISQRPGLEMHKATVLAESTFQIFTTTLRSR